MHSLKLTQIGNSVGIVVPKDLLARWHVDKGDAMYITESPDGDRITPYNPVFEAQMKLARQIMDKRKAVLHELAK